MTDEFIPDQEGQEDESAGKIVFFGVAISPPVLAAAIAVAGVAFAVWLAWTQVKPAMDKAGEIQDQIAEKESQKGSREKLEQKKQEALAEQEQVKQTQRQMLSIFASEESLDTLLLDLNQQLDRINTELTSAQLNARLESRECPAYVKSNFAQINNEVGGFFATATLSQFEPKAPGEGRSRRRSDIAPNDPFETVKDSSYGQGANNMLKRRFYAVELQGNFNQTQRFLQQLEQLQPLLVVENLTTEVQERPVLVANRVGPLPTCQPDIKINTAFTVQALVPLSQEEIAAAAPKPEEGEGEENE